jgi:hypothetical protein
MSEARALTTGAPDVIITVQITVSGEALPSAARRLVTDLQALATSGYGAPPPDVRVLPPAISAPIPTPSREVIGPREQLIQRDTALPRDASPLRLVGHPRLGDVVHPRLGDRAALRLETRSRTVARDGAPVHLARREYDLLAFLCQHPRRVFSRGQLLRQVWDYEMIGGERTVDVHVRRLRAKLGRCADGIVTVRGVGYRFDDDAGIAITIVNE